MKLDLAQLEAEAHAEDEERDPVELDLGDGSVPVVLPHPQDMSVEQLAELFAAEQAGNPFAVLRALIGDGDAYDTFARSATAGGLNLLIDKWREAYGLPSPGEARASRPSSNGSARRSKPTSRTGTRRSA